MTQRLNISWPSTDPGTETGRDCCLCSFPNKHSHIPWSRSSAGGGRETETVTMGCGHPSACQFLPSQQEMLLSSCAFLPLVQGILPTLPAACVNGNQIGAVSVHMIFVWSSSCNDGESCVAYQWILTSYMKYYRKISRQELIAKKTKWSSCDLCLISIGHWLGKVYERTVNEL